MAISSIGKFIVEKCDKAIKTPFIAKRLESGLKDPASFAAKVMVYSLVSKDFVNCAIYTYQSANNEKIPKEKRSFVASLDLINGILNVTGQLFAFYVVDKMIIPHMFAKHFSGTLKDGSYLDGEGATKKSMLMKDNMRELVISATNPKISNVPNLKLVNKVKDELKSKGFDFEAFNKLDDKIKKVKIDDIVRSLDKEFGKGSDKMKAVEKGFALLIGALATTALVKRTLVPLIATPLAGSLSEYVDKKHVPKDRMYYETAAVAAGRYENKLDKTAFSNFSSKNK